MGTVRKITTGFVVQTFDDTGEPINQEFVAGDQVEWLDDDENIIEEVDPVPYLPFNMIQPNLEDDLVALCEDNEVMVDAIKEYFNNR